MLRTIIIDDEAKARRMLTTLLKENCPQVELVAEAADVPAGVKAIQQFQPHLVFSDIDMPGYNGFQLLDFVDKANFELIYCTGHDEFALKAFEVSAIDYLLKPVQIAQLVSAVQKAERLCLSSAGQQAQRMHTLKENLREDVLTKMALPVTDGLLFVNIEDIIFLEAEGAYTYVNLKDGNKLIICKKLKEFENMLSNNKNFFRIHRSFLVNTTFIKQYLKSDGGSVLLQNNISVPVARERKDDFQRLVESIKV